MLSRIIPVARSATTSVARLQAVRCMSGYAPSHWKTEKELAVDTRTTMDDLPVPEGSWQENYSKRNAKFNMYLASSLLLLVASSVMLYQSGAVYLHDTPPLKKSS